VFGPLRGAIPFEDKMSKALLREGLKKPKEPKPIEKKLYSEKASVKKVVKILESWIKKLGVLLL